jgi:hypothetical protein
MLNNEWNEDIVVKGKKFISSRVFCERHRDTSPGTIQIASFNNSPHVFKFRNKLYVNEEALIRQKKFYEKIWLQSHENYYEITEYISDYKLAQLLCHFFNDDMTKWTTFLNQNLFSYAWSDKSLFATKMSDNLWAFFRFSTFLIRRINKYDWKPKRYYKYLREEYREMK